MKTIQLFKGNYSANWKSDVFSWRPAFHLMFSRDN